MWLPGGTPGAGLSWSQLLQKPAHALLIPALWLGLRDLDSDTLLCHDGGRKEVCTPFCRPCEKNRGSESGSGASPVVLFAPLETWGGLSSGHGRPPWRLRQWRESWPGGCPGRHSSFTPEDRSRWSGPCPLMVSTHFTHGGPSTLHNPHQARPQVPVSVAPECPGGIPFN